MSTLVLLGGEPVREALFPAYSVIGKEEIEAAVRAAVEDGRLTGDETITARMTLTIETLGLSKDIEGNITLS